jgi:hypothetical protein
VVDAFELHRVGSPRSTDVCGRKERNGGRVPDLPTFASGIVPRMPEARSA